MVAASGSARLLDQLGAEARRQTQDEPPAGRDRLARLRPSGAGPGG